MKHSGPAPDEVKLLPPSGAILSKHKGIALMFIFCTKLYPSIVETTPEVQKTLMLYAQHGASDTLRAVYDIDIRATSINLYHTQAVNRAQDAGLEWDKYAVAHIIRSQVDDQATFEEVVSFLANHCSVSPVPSLPVTSADY